VSRAQFILGKFAGLSTLVVVNMVLMTLCLVFVLYGVTGRLDTSILLPLPFMLVEFLLLAALAIMFSSFSTPTLSAIFTISLYVLGHLSPEMRDIGARGHSALSSVTSAIYRVIPNLEAMNLREEVVHSLQVDWSMVIISILYGLVYTAALLVFTVFIFGRRDLR
jgi:ABC-type transport system involved in multi-copper enzyme maturation permease subunit